MHTQSILLMPSVCEMKQAIGMKNVLVTGATGVLGRAVALEALTSGHSVILPVRARDEYEAQARIHHVLGKIALTHTDNITILAADILAPNLGLAADVAAQLQQATDFIIHCAGDVSFNLQARERVMRTNLEGTRNILQFSRDCLHLQGFAHVSTAYVCGDADGQLFEDDLELGQQFSTPYEESKYLAECLVREYQMTGLPIIIFRPSIILENIKNLQLTRLPAINAIILLLHTVMQTVKKGTPQKIRIPADPDAIADLVPIDYVARSIVALTLAPDAYGQTYHLTNPQSPTLAEFIEILNEELGGEGYAFTCVDPSSVNLADLTPVERMLLLNLQPYLPHLTAQFRFDVKNVERIRALCQLPACAPVGRETLANVIRESILHADA